MFNTLPSPNSKNKQNSSHEWALGLTSKKKEKKKTKNGAANVENALCSRNGTDFSS